jgi:hypothetical protein
VSLSPENKALVERVFGCALSELQPNQKRALKIEDGSLNRLLNAARSEGSRSTEKGG